MPQSSIISVAFHYEGDYAKEYSDRFVFLVAADKKDAAEEIIRRTAQSYRRDYIYGGEADINRFQKVVNVRLKEQNIDYVIIPQLNVKNVDISLWD